MASFFYIVHLVGAVFLHPFYLSVTTVNYKASTGVLEVSSRIFYDDLEKGIKPASFPDLDIVHPKKEDRKQVDSLLNAYLQKHLRIKVNGNVVPLQYLGYQIKEDAAWCFLESRKIEAPHQVQIFNSILFEQQEEQSNIIHLTFGGERKSTKLDNPKNLASFTLK